MKKDLGVRYICIAMGFMLVYFFVSPLVEPLFRAVLGGGVEQSYLYPIYGGIIILAGMIVGAARVILREIRELKTLVEGSKTGTKGE